MNLDQRGASVQLKPKPKLKELRVKLKYELLDENPKRKWMLNW